MVARGSAMDGALSLLTLAARIAVAWTLLSLLITAFWWLLLEFGRRFGSRPASKPSAREERELNAEVRAIYAELDDDDQAGGEAPDETAGSDVIVLIVGTGSARKR